MTVNDSTGIPESLWIGEEKRTILKKALEVIEMDASLLRIVPCERDDKWDKKMPQTPNACSVVSHPLKAGAGSIAGGISGRQSATRSALIQTRKGGGEKAW